MKFVLPLFGMLVILIISCKENKPIELDYCEMLAKDQSYVNHEEIDPEKRKSNREKRLQLFDENYGKIIARTKQAGFPNVSFEKLPQDSCKYWAITGTLIHMAQTKPTLFFSEETISLFKKEMDKGNLDAEDLTPAFRVSFSTYQFCDTLKPNIMKAINTWGMQPFLNGEPTFKKCD